MTNRRSFLFGLGAALITAPAIVKATGIMPVKAIDPNDWTFQKFEDMKFSIKKTSVIAKSRQLGASYTMELAQDQRIVGSIISPRSLGVVSLTVPSAAKQWEWATIGSNFNATL